MRHENKSTLAATIAPHREKCPNLVHECRRHGISDREDHTDTRFITTLVFQVLTTLQHP